MPRNKFVHSRSLAVFGLAALVIAIAAVLFAPAALGNSDDFVRISRHTYDEVFQGAQEAIERNGWFVTSTDKDKGIITGNGLFGRTKNTFEVHIESVSPAPETRVTIDVKMSRINRKEPAVKFFTELQKVLATYR